METYNEILQAAREILYNHKIADADVDAWYLLDYVTGMNRADFLLNRGKPITQTQAARYRELVDLRALHIPLQHLTGTQEFMGLEFDVTKDVLIPRQDTESLVEEVLKYCTGKSVLDMCTGSGCIIISLAKLGRICKATAADISDKALCVASGNVKKHQVEVELIQSDLYERIDGVYDIIVSNPPYINTQDMKGLMPEVRDHEPKVALEAGPDGLIYYRRIVAGLMSHLSRDGRVFFEIGHDQGEQVKDILQRAGFTQVQIKKDLSGHDRVVSAKKC